MAKDTNVVYEAIGPWADVDPIPLRGLTPRLKDMAGKTIGLLANAKTAAQPILTVVEEKLKARYPGIKTVRWTGSYSTVSGNLGREQDEVSPKFRDFVNGVDAVVAAIGD
jgi:hypothetical protein